MDESMAPFEPDPVQAEVNALSNLLGQVGDPELAHAAGAIDDDEYAELKAKKLAYTAAIAAYGKGRAPDVDKLLEQMREKVAEPSQIETNTANIDYLMMTVGGEQ